MLEDLDKCDMYGSDETKCVLTINDYGVTADPIERLKLMRCKLANYAAAISDGLIGDKQLERRQYQIEINCGYNPCGLYDEFKLLEILDEKSRLIQISINVAVRLKPNIDTTGRIGKPKSRRRPNQ